MHQCKIGSECRKCHKRRKERVFCRFGLERLFLAMKRDYFMEVAFGLVTQGTEFLYIFLCDDFF